MPGFEVNPADWNSMMDHIDLNDPSQREMAGFITGKFSMVKGSDEGGAESTTDDNSTQIYPRTKLEQKEYDRQKLEVTLMLYSPFNRVLYHFLTNHRSIGFFFIKVLRNYRMFY